MSTKSRRSKETTGNNSFVSDYRDLIRDMFVYGNKTVKPEKMSDLRNSIDAVKNALIADHGRLDWTGNRKERLYFTATPRLFDRNPFQKLYLFCAFANHGMLTDCIHTLFLMRPDLAVPFLEDYDTDDDRAPAWIKKREKYMRAFLRRLDAREGFETADIYTAVTAPHRKNLFEKPAIKTLKNRLEAMAEAGLIREEHARGKKASVWRTEHPVMLRDVLRAGEGSGRGRDASFVSRFHAAMEFFARDEALGAYGQQITLRMLPAYPARGCFRFRQDYLHDTLNDYLVLTLLHAIEAGLWCRLYVRHGINGRRRLTFCRPLEIRKGDASGRTYLMVYDPAARMMHRERLEFIDEVHFFRMGTDDKSDIRHAGEGMRHSWGVSLQRPLDRDGNAAAESTTRHLRFSVSGDSAQADILYETIRRRARTGQVSRKGNTITFDADVLETIEVRPFIRTFYGFLDAVEGMEDGIRKSTDRIYDVENFLETDFTEVDWFYGQRDADPQGYRPNNPVRPREIERGRSASKQQQYQIFNAYHSIYFHIAGNAVTEYAKTGKPLEDCIADAIRVFRGFTGAYTVPEVKKDLCAHLEGDGNFMTADGERRYVIEDRESFFGLDFLPLTPPEQRWLLAVLGENSPCAPLFFTREERTAMLQALAKGGASPFRFEHIIRYERDLPVFDPAAEANAVLFRTILGAVSGTRKLQVFVNGAAHMICPLKIEYARRDNTFFLFGTEGKEAVSFALKDIRRVTVMPGSFAKDYDAALALLDDALEHSVRSVTIAFGKDAGLAERVLSAFSFLRKKLKPLSGEADDFYELVLWYHADEEEEMAERILSFGTRLSIRERNHVLKRMIRERLALQRERMRVPVRTDRDELHR